MRNKGVAETSQLTTAQRDALVVGPNDTGLIFNIDTGEYNFWNGSWWVGVQGEDWAEFAIPAGVNSGLTFAAIGISLPAGKTLVGASITALNQAGTPNRWHTQKYSLNPAETSSFSWFINADAENIQFRNMPAGMVGELARIVIYYE